MYDLIVVGGGSGGLTATMVARKLGARVLLVDKKALGGDCLFTGCVPSKTLIRTAALAHQMRHADRWGLAPSPPVVDGKRVMQRVRDVIAHIAAHEEALFPLRSAPPATPDGPSDHVRSLGADVRIGAPRFVAPDALELDGERLPLGACILATGSRPKLPPVDGLSEVAPLTNETIFDIDAIPPSLIVLGGGPIGCELGQAMARLGARVTIVQSADRLLEKEEPECSTEVRARLEAEGVVVHTAMQARRARRDGGEIVIACAQSGAPVELRAAAVLVATGRAPNLEGLGLREAGIDHDESRLIVDEELRTTNARVFGVGDVIARFNFTHMAGYEAVIAARNALLPLASKADWRVVPWCTFTAPEVARVGMTEAEARRQSDAVTVLRSRFGEVDRALCDGESEGFCKLVAIRGRLVGAHIVGPHAGELIHPCVLALKEKLAISSLASMTWVYPTLSEAVRKAAQARYDELLESKSVRTAVRLLRAIKSV